MGNKNTPKGINERFKEFLGLVVLAIIILFVIVRLIIEFITNYVIPAVIGLFLIILGLVVTVLLIRVFTHLFSRLTLEKRFRRKRGGLNEKVSQLDAYVSSAEQRIPALLATERSAVEAGVKDRKAKKEELLAERRDIATVLADHLEDRLDRVKGSRESLRRKLNGHGNDKLTEKLKRRNEEASALENEINILWTEYRAVPDPAFERKRRKYPWISAFDRFVASRFNGKHPQGKGY